MGIFDSLKKHKNKNIENDNGLNEIYHNEVRPGFFTTSPGIGTGSLKERFYKKNGKLDGVFLEYDGLGKIRTKLEYKDGVRIYRIREGCSEKGYIRDGVLYRDNGTTSSIITIIPRDYGEMNRSPYNDVINSDVIITDETAITPFPGHYCPTCKKFVIPHVVQNWMPGVVRDYSKLGPRWTSKHQRCGSVVQIKENKEQEEKLFEIYNKVRKLKITKSFESQLEKMENTKHKWKLISDRWEYAFNKIANENPTPKWDVAQQQSDKIELEGKEKIEKQEIPDWFDGTVYKKGGVVKSVLNGSEYELNNIELSIYDNIMGSLIVFDTEAQYANKSETTKAKENYKNGVTWFRNNKKKLYHSLFPYDINNPFLTERTAKLDFLTTDISTEIDLPFGYQNIGLDRVYDGVKFLKANNGSLSQYIPLLFIGKGELQDHILIGVPTLVLAKDIIDEIIEKNGVTWNFEKLEPQEGWSYLYANKYFGIGYMTKHLCIRINLFHRLSSLDPSSKP